MMRVVAKDLNLRLFRSYYANFDGMGAFELFIGAAVGVYRVSIKLSNESMWLSAFV